MPSSFAFIRYLDLWLVATPSPGIQEHPPLWEGGLITKLEHGLVRFCPGEHRGPSAPASLLALGFVGTIQDKRRSLIATAEIDEARIVYVIPGLTWLLAAQVERVRQLEHRLSRIIPRLFSSLKEWQCGSYTRDIRKAQGKACLKAGCVGM
jgi:hypothetical protein